MGGSEVESVSDARLFVILTDSLITTPYKKGCLPARLATKFGKCVVYIFFLSLWASGAFCLFVLAPVCPRICLCVSGIGNAILILCVSV